MSHTNRSLEDGIVTNESVIEPSFSTKSKDEMPSEPQPEDPIDEKIKAILAEKYGYQIGGKLAAGAFGEVFRATNYTLSDPRCAVKVIKTRNMSRRVKNEYMPRELTALMDVKHRYVVRVFDIFRHGSTFLIFMEFAGNGDLTTYIHKNRMLKEPLVAIWFVQVCEAMHYLHIDLCLAHRDIKLDNILLDDACNTKLTDLGFVYIGNKVNMYEERTKEFCGTLPFQSPQITQEKPYNPFKADIWAMGVTLFALLTNKFPFHYHSEDTQQMIAEQINYPGHIRSRFHADNSQSARDLVELMLTPEEDERPTMTQVLLHEFLAPSEQVEENEEDSLTASNQD